MVLSDPSVDVAVLEIARGGLLRAGMGVRHCDVGAVLNVKADHLGLRGIGTLEQLAEVKRIVVEVARDTAILNADDPLCLKMADYTEAEHLCYVTMDPTHELVRRAHQGGRARRGAGDGNQGPDDHDLRSRRPHPAALDPPDSGDARGPGDAQRAERDVRGGDGVQHGAQAGGHPARAPHLRHHVLPGAGPDEHLRRASVQGDPRLRPQSGGGRGDVPAGRSAGRERTADLRARRAGRPAGRGHPRDRADRGGTVRPLHLPARRPASRPQARTRYRSCCARRCWRNGVPADQILVIPSEQAGGRRRAPRGRAAATWCSSSRDAITRSWKQIIQFRPEAAPPPAERPPRVAAGAGVLAAVAPMLEDSRREFVRDSRGVWLPREADD